MDKVYQIYKRVISRDCWGKFETEYEPTEHCYKSLEEAQNHVGDGKIEVLELH